MQNQMIKIGSTCDKRSSERCKSVRCATHMKIHDCFHALYLHPEDMMYLIPIQFSGGMTIDEWERYQSLFENDSCSDASNFRRMRKQARKRTYLDNPKTKRKPCLRAASIASRKADECLQPTLRRTLSVEAYSTYKSEAQYYRQASLPFELYESNARVQFDEYVCVIPTVSLDDLPDDVIDACWMSRQELLECDALQLDEGDSSDADEEDSIEYTEC
mmetsp:Transcript_2338/g.3413  ORF Transcript_2338/g.3413 Transcript_2338/m.3413 type:complete len:217 (+) Transcript_2338:253-903(+)